MPSVVFLQQKAVYPLGTPTTLQVPPDQAYSWPSSLSMRVTIRVTIEPMPMQARASTMTIQSLCVIQSNMFDPLVLSI
jgi:hypothetical protein